MSSSVVYVYCDEQNCEKIKSILVDYPMEVFYNQKAEQVAHQKNILLHYKLSDLDCDTKQYLIEAMQAGAHVEPLISYLDNNFGLTEVELLHSGYFLHMKSFSILSRRRNKTAKRILDILFAVLIGLVAVPIGLVTALAIKLESPGPIFFRQRRTGLYNQEFDVIKFRSMRSDAEKDGAQWASKNDSRVTKVGNFIRKTRIDELPQIINVFKNEMSIIGPRPEREHFITELEKTIPYYRFRHAIKPGITGLAQVKYPYGASLEDAVWKHKYDLFYIKHQSIWLDMKILALTVKTVVFGMGR